MKKFLAPMAIILVASISHADIQAPPASEQGPTRKLGRGLSNILFGASEVVDALEATNYSDGNSAAFGFGVVRGVGRMLARMGYGIYEVLLFPFPTQKGTFKPPYRSDVPWIHSGYSEFPPELGFETRYDYSRSPLRSPN